MAVIGLFAAEAETPYTQRRFSEERARYGISADSLAHGRPMTASWMLAHPRRSARTRRVPPEML